MFIHMLNIFDPRFVLQSHNGECLKPEEADRLIFLAKNLEKKKRETHLMCTNVETDLFL